MKNCALCNKKLNMMNSPTFGAGKMKDNNELCYNCYVEVHKKIPTMPLKIKDYSIIEIKEMLANPPATTTSKIREHILSLNLKHINTIRNLKEIDEIPNILAENETLDNIIQGFYNNGSGILISTSRRLVFIDKGLLYGLKVEDFPLDKISSIQYETGMMFGKLKIHSTNNNAVIDNVDKEAVKIFAEFVRNKISSSNDKIENNSNDILKQLEKLAQLKSSGILTEDEFNEQKSKLLQKL